MLRDNQTQNTGVQQPFLAIAKFTVSSSSVSAIIFILAESTQLRSSQLTRSGKTSGCEFTLIFF